MRRSLLIVLRPNSAHYANTDLSRITTELWEIPAFVPAENVKTLHMIIQHYFIGVIMYPVLERGLCRGFIRKACRIGDAWREKMY